MMIDRLLIDTGMKYQYQWAHIRKLHARALVEAHDEVLRAYYETLQYTPAKAQEHIIDIAQHRMSLCRRDNRRTKDMKIREANGSRPKVIRMGMDG